MTQNFHIEFLIHCLTSSNEFILHQMSTVEEHIKHARYIPFTVMLFSVIGMILTCIVKMTAASP